MEGFYNEILLQLLYGLKEKQTHTLSYKTYIGNSYTEILLKDYSNVYNFKVSRGLNLWTKEITYHHRTISWQCYGKYNQRR